jgi:hypothetical protein
MERSGSTQTIYSDGNQGKCDVANQMHCKARRVRALSIWRSEHRLPPEGKNGREMGGGGNKSKGNLM